MFIVILKSMESAKKYNRQQLEFQINTGIAEVHCVLSCTVKIYVLHTYTETDSHDSP